MTLNEREENSLMYGILHALVTKSGGSLEVDLNVPVKDHLMFMVDEKRKKITVLISEKDTVN